MSKASPFGPIVMSLKVPEATLLQPHPVLKPAPLKTTARSADHQAVFNRETLRAWSHRAVVMCTSSTVMLSQGTSGKHCSSPAPPAFANYGGAARVVVKIGPSTAF